MKDMSQRPLSISHSNYIMNLPKFKEWISDKELTQAQFSSILGVSTQRFYYILRKQKLPLTIRVYNSLKKTFNRLGVSNYDEFFIEYEQGFLK